MKILEQFTAGSKPKLPSIVVDPFTLNSVTCISIRYDKLWSETIDEILEKENNPVLLHSRDSFKDHYSGKYPVKEIPELPGYSGTKLREQLKT
mgnify:CR=1 FL=1